MKILVVAAHPDDEVLGCGGTIARLTKEGHKACSFILGEGVTSRDKNRDRTKRYKEIEELKRQLHNANRIIGIKQSFADDLPDNKFDTIPMLDIVKKIEEIKNRIKPDIIFTHYENDLNIDHSVVYKAVITATRPLKKETVKQIYSFEILSSTEWNYPTTFSPDVFFDISMTLDIKLRAIKEYVRELKKYPHPRSLKGIKLNSEYWGMRSGLKHAEAFKNIRCVR